MDKPEQQSFTPRIVVCYCRNAMAPDAELVEGTRKTNGCHAVFAALACSSKMQPSYLLKILADGADGVLVLACPESRCRYLVGSVRAEKRISYVHQLMASAKIDPLRLALERRANLSEKDLLDSASRRAEILSPIGPNPMKKGSST